jgi:GTP cyclohydrolase I
MSESKTKFKPANGKTETIVMDANQRIVDAVKIILESVGEDPNRDGLLETPKRVARALNELLEGYTKDLKDVVNGALFEVQYGQGEMIIVQDIPYDSMCEHHMLPFSGTAHVAYIPSDKIIGLSKIPRIVEMYARRLQVQERLTNQVADAIEQVLEAEGVMVVFDGEHMCAALRGIKKKGMNMRTTAMRGSFATDPKLRQEFRELLQ